MVETELPDADTLIEAAREAMAGIRHVSRNPAKAAEERRQAASRALDRWAPAIDERTDLPGAARFLGNSLNTLKRRRARALADGTPDWPEPDVKIGYVEGWSYRTIAVHEAARPGRGRHGSATAPLPDDIAVYLSIADLAEHWGVAANTVHSWRTRYRPGRSPEETAKVPDFPPPDVIVGKLGHPLAGWQSDRVDELDSWQDSLAAADSRSGRPRASRRGGHPALQRAGS